MNVFLAFSSFDIDVETNGVKELPLALIHETWNSCANDDDDAVEAMEQRLESQWGEATMVVGAADEAKQWLNDLNVAGKVSGVDETMGLIWAIASTKDEAEALLAVEVAKYE